MNVIINKAFEEKAKKYKKPLLKTVVRPDNIIKITENKNAFQNLSTETVKSADFPISLMPYEEIVFDFGCHNVGYFHFSLDHYGEEHICDAPVKFRFQFGEFPLEIVTPEESYNGSLGSGWLQNDIASFAFLPAESKLNRRFSFRYVKITRTDSGAFPIKFTDIFSENVSAVNIENVENFPCKDDRFKKIYEMSLLTLKECEQEVFEDGPKRDRRLWIGDLKLQALTDYVTFRNTDLVKRCLYLFAAYIREHKMVAPCVFPDSPPYVDPWTFCDYSLFFISCLYDYLNFTDDTSVTEELFETAVTQAKTVGEYFNKGEGIIELRPFIDWCPDLDKSTAILGVYIYTLKQLKTLSEKLSKNCDFIDGEISCAKKALFCNFDAEKGLFRGKSGQISWHSQIWAILSGELSEKEAEAVLGNIKKENTPYTMRTPYMMHYYIEALHLIGKDKDALSFIKEYWGQILDAGFDCCPEVFNPENEFESPYRAPEINSACHAWSCTPAYWIKKLYNREDLF